MPQEFTIKQIARIHDKLHELDGRPTIKGDQIIIIPHKFRDGARTKIAYDVGAFEKANEVVAKIRERIMKEVGGEGCREIQRDSDEFVKFCELWEKEAEQTIPVEFIPIPEDSLKIEENGIAPSTINALRPILISKTQPVPDSEKPERESEESEE